MGFFQEIRDQYGQHIVSLLSKFKSLKMKLAAQNNRKIFLISCRRNVVHPPHLFGKLRGISRNMEFHDAGSGQQVHRTLKRLGNSLLSLEISITIKNITYITESLSKIEDRIVTFLPRHVWMEFRGRVEVSYERAFRKIKDTHLQKLQRIKREQVPGIQFKSSWFRNISSSPIPTEIADFLALGPKFSLRPNLKDISIPRIIAEVESINMNPSTHNKALITARIVNATTNYCLDSRFPTDPLNALFNRTKKFLRQNPNILVMQADKGNVTVAMDKQAYIDLSTNILSDTSYYQPMETDHNSTTEQKANALMLQLRKDGLLDDEDNKDITIYNSIPAKFYGLPKIHKPQLSLRPIVSSISTPNSKIAKFLTNILTRSYNKDNRYFTPDSFEFSSFINGFSLPNGFVLVSFDVTSLYSNIPLDLAIRSIENNWQDISNNCRLNLDKFKELLCFVFDTTYFTFNNQVYKQTFGTPMGSKLSPIIAQYVMDYVLDLCTSVLDFEMPFIRKYVDDIICAVPSEKVDETLGVFNSFHPSIQFTTERESKCSVPFLDTLVIREGTTVITDWYRKSMASGRYINYNSFHTTKMKINVVLGLKNRVLRVSNPRFHPANLNKLKDVLLQNSFPPHLINRLLFSTPHIPTQIEDQQQRSQITPEDSGSQPVNPFSYKSIPHIEGLSHKLTSILRTIENVKIALKNVKTIQTLFSRVKDKTPLMQNSNLVYSIPCNNCEAHYVGQTARTLNYRITSHRSDIERGVESCGLASHCIQTGHVPDFERTRILDRETNKSKREFLEMVRISQSENTMNTKKDTKKLNAIYTYLLHLDERLSSRRSGPEEEQGINSV